MSGSDSFPTTLDHVDVLIVGAGIAGIAGIGLAYHLSTKQPGKTFAIVEARDAIGGTWQLRTVADPALQFTASTLKPAESVV